MSKRRRKGRVLTWEELMRPAPASPVHGLDRMRYIGELPPLEDGTRIIEVETFMGIPAFVAAGEHGFKFPRAFNSVDALRAAVEAAA